MTASEFMARENGDVSVILAELAVSAARAIRSWQQALSLAETDAGAAMSHLIAAEIQLNQFARLEITDTLRPIRAAIARFDRELPDDEDDEEQAPGNASTEARVVAINKALGRIADADPSGDVSAVDAARELDRMGLLRDSPSRPGLPLRNLLRAGSIPDGYQRNGRWWYIRRPKDAARTSTP